LTIAWCNGSRSLWAVLAQAAGKATIKLQMSLFNVVRPTLSLSQPRLVRAKWRGSCLMEYGCCLWVFSSYCDCECTFDFRLLHIHTVALLDVFRKRLMALLCFWLRTSWLKKVGLR
jgi:hypothetical protein